MKKKYLPVYALLAAAALLAWLAWPLPRCFTRGIPTAAHTGAPNVQPAAPSDSLQLLYHFWLAGDMLAGHTRAFYNLYEFNTGDDADRFMPGSYYFPFSLIHAGGARLLGTAAGWNLTALFSLWLTMLFTWYLARRFTASLAVAGLAAAAALLLPFRWINLFGGSPAGFAMAWPPAVWLGIDMAVRQRRMSGGLLAGVAVLMACWCDSHVFFFTVLAIPAWCVIALAADRHQAWRRPRMYPKIIMALTPLVLLTLLALAFPWFLKGVTVQVMGAPPESAAVTTRTLKEIKLYSPPARGVFDWQATGLAEHVYLGLALPALLAAGSLVLSWRAAARHRTRDFSRLAVCLMTSGVIAAVVVLALGVYGPYEAMPLRIARELIPPWRMIRQPAKIFTLMPSLLAVAAALAGDALTRRTATRTAGFVVLTLLIAGAAWEYGRRINAVIAILPPAQAAYAAVTADAAGADAAPRAVVVPLWPGDSHYTSMYQYFAMQQRIRLLNGYRPFVRQNYLTNVFERLVSINQGWLTPDQLAHLRGMRIKYIIVHEDLFPEKVSPFPVAFTIQNLLRNPDLALLAQDQSVWAFTIRDAALDQTNAAPVDSAPDAMAHWNVFGAARRWEAETARHVNTRVIEDDTASGGRALCLADEAARMQTPPVSAWPAPDLRWLVRARGHGLLTGTLIAGEFGLPTGDLPVQTDDWRWHAVPADLLDGYAPLSLKLEWQGGAVEVDATLLTAGAWNPAPAVGDVISIPAPCFFHAGYIDRATGSVVLRQAADPQALIFYGPKLPLTAGRYSVELEYDSPATPGTPAGQFNIRQRGSDPVRWTPVFAGYPARAEFELPLNLPFHLELLFTGQADLRIRRVNFTRQP